MGRAQGSLSTVSTDRFAGAFGTRRGAVSDRDRFAARRARLTEDEREYDLWLYALGVFGADHALVETFQPERDAREAILAIFDRQPAWVLTDLHDAVLAHAPALDRRRVTATVSMMCNGELEMFVLGYEGDEGAEPRVPVQAQIERLSVRRRPGTPHPAR